MRLQKEKNDDNWNRSKMRWIFKFNNITVLEADINMGTIFDHPACFCLFVLLMAHTIFTDSLWYSQALILLSSGYKVSMVIEENNQNKQGGRKLKTIDYCLQYRSFITLNTMLWILNRGVKWGTSGPSGGRQISLYVRGVYSRRLRKRIVSIKVPTHF